MRISAEDRRQMHEMGKAYISLLETFASSNFTFDAAIVAMRHMQKEVLRPMLDLMSRYGEAMCDRANEMNRTSNFNLIKKIKLKSEIHDLKKMLKNLQSEIFPDNSKNRIKELFKDAPVKNLSVHEKESTNTTTTRSQFGFFAPVTKTTHVLDCSVEFSNGKKVSWHTLDDGPELDQVREVYNENLRSLGHIDIPNSSVRRY